MKTIQITVSAYDEYNSSKNKTFLVLTYKISH